MYHSEPEREPMRSSPEMNEVHRNLRGMMHLLEKMVALKDPYTAGHQQNVAALSVAIGRKMGLAATQLESVEMAGKIHDIGKIGIPTPIFSANLEDWDPLKWRWCRNMQPMGFNY